MSKFYIGLVLSCVLMFSAVDVQADSLAPVTDVNVTGGILDEITYNSNTYASTNLLLGTTTRWYIIDNVEYLWPDGDPPPPGTPTVGGTSTPKQGDIGAKADNFLFQDATGATDISSIDGIDFQQTIFPELVDTIFVFERGGSDTGLVYPILADDSLGAGLAITAGGFPYGDTGVSVNGQNAHGYVLETDIPVKGLRIAASGHDALTVAAVPEPMTLGLLAFGGLAVLRRRR
jgi:hypothetical protein